MMMHGHSPVTEDELHAYVDGELPTDRHAAVEAWLAAHPDDAARVASWRVQTEAIRSRYAAVAEEAVPERLKLERLAGRSRSWVGIAAAATILAFVIGSAGGWLARGASAAAPSRFDVFTAEALDAYKLYVVEVRHPVEVPGAERAHLVQWLSKRVGYEVRAPNLEPIGLKLVGGRLLPGPTGASAFFMYENGSGERFTLYCAHANDAQTQMRYRGGEHEAAFYWADRDLVYVMSGPSQREKLQQVARAAYDQLDSHATGRI